jgi:hypothetical protein
MTDMVNRPSHYVEGRQYEPLKVIEDWQLNYRLGSALKYISRAGRKDPSKTVEDLRKSIFYLEREIEAINATDVPYATTYEDVLEDYAACAADGYEYILETNADTFGWDDSLGPVEVYSDDPDPEEAALQYPSCDFDVAELHKDLDQFEENEIISTFERRGIMFGVDKNGTTYTLGLYKGPTT